MALELNFGYYLILINMGIVINLHYFALIILEFVILVHYFLYPSHY